MVLAAMKGCGAPLWRAVVGPGELPLQRKSKEEVGPQAGRPSSEEGTVHHPAPTILHSPQGPPLLLTAKESKISPQTSIGPGA
jgi:hypothetical protein